MTTVEVFAPAKINLTLHVTGRRADGYHLLDSLVVFAGVGDRIRVSDSEDLGLTIDGPFSEGLSPEGDNLVLRAARRLATDKGAAIVLTKNLPVASGVGGGSADAAATLRALSMLWGLPDPRDDPAAFQDIGADVPVCIRSEPARMSGIGAQLTQAPPMPEAHFVLVNPLKAVATQDVFRELAKDFMENTPMPALPVFGDLRDLAEFMFEECCNDLGTPAEALLPEIAEVRSVLGATANWRTHGMSGSGATCFALYDDAATASAAEAYVKSQNPDWWVVSAPLLKNGAEAAPQLIRATT